MNVYNRQIETIFTIGTDCIDMNGEATSVETEGIEVVDTESETVVEPENIDSSDDVISVIEGMNENNLVAADRVFQEIYEEAHDTAVPDQKVQTGQIISPIVRPSARNIEQELSISIPVILPDGESVKMYTALYGSDNTDDCIDRIINQYTTGEPKISKLMGVNIPLIYIDGEWKLYLIQKSGVFGIGFHSWVANNIRSLISEKDIFAFGKDYDTPFEDDPKLIQNGDVASLKSITSGNQNN